MSMREERRVVTAVFADLVGSTALGERLDPEELKLVVGEAVSRMVVAVEAFDGHVKDPRGRRRSGSHRPTSPTSCSTPRLP